MTGTAIERFEDVEAAADAAAAAIAAAIAAGVEARGTASLMVTGGRTPGPIYDRLAALPLAWDKVQVTLSDERWVARSSPDSNGRLLHDRLFIGPAEQASFVPLWGGEDTPEEGAAAAEARVRAMPRPFDLVLLGMGEDGHVASLFPGNPIDPQTERLCVAVAAGAGRPPSEPRISLTLPVLLDARQIVLFVTGEAKAAVLQNPERLPVGAVLRGPAPVRVIWSP